MVAQSYTASLAALALMACLVACEPAEPALPIGSSLVRFEPQQAQVDDDSQRSAAHLLQGLAEGDHTHLAVAARAYSQRSIDGELSQDHASLALLSRYLAAEGDDREQLVRQRDARRLVRFFSADDWAPLEAFLRMRVGDPGGPGQAPPLDDAQRRIAWELLAYNGPDRESWDAPEETLALLGLDQGMAVADVGSGPGFYTFRLARALGPEGRVYAVELDRLYTDHVARVARQEGWRNVEAVLASSDDLGLPADSLDLAFLCATYQQVYLSSPPAEQEAWLASLHKALRPGGRLAVIENELSPAEGTRSYQGVRIHRRLIQGHLEAHGFRLIAEHDPTPQRYLLLFEES